MRGRDPLERHRAATPLELLFDLAFVVAFGQAADQLAHAIAADHIAVGLTGFAFIMAAACWAWINFSWFASAYDTDDWFYRITTMVQMAGVVVFALGIPAVFHSIEEGVHVDNAVVVAGYVVMRVAFIAQWVRVAVQDPARRAAALTFIRWLGLAQAGWVLMVIIDPPMAWFIPLATALFALEMTAPVRAERAAKTPWHAGHIAERYGLLAIIALGEGVIGTVAAVATVIEHQDWSLEAILIVTAGLGLTFGLWWIYFMMPSGLVLARFRERGFGWGYFHIVLYAAIAGMGAGLHVAAYVVEGESEVGVPGAITAVAVPVLVFVLALFGLYSWLLRELDRFHVGLFAGCVAMLALAIALAWAGAPLGLCLIVVTLAPVVIVVGYETIGHRHAAVALERALG
jgi:low temperature requirement protein LtrA